MTIIEDDEMMMLCELFVDVDGGFAIFLDFAIVDDVT
jgi:hypothetical protein